MAALPRPKSGLVIGYCYLSESEYRAGKEEGAKDRPCAVVIASRTEDGDLVVTVAPITYSPPADPRDDIEVAAEVKRGLKLDDQPSWVICAELNRFVWPGPDLRPVSRRAPGQFVHGTPPEPFMRQIFERLTALRDVRKPRVVFREA